MLKNIAKIIDHTNINPSATEKDIKKTCQEAKHYGFRSVCVNPRWVSFVKEELGERDIKVVVLIDPPMGLSAHLKRMEVSKKAKADGADELDIVLNIIDLKYGRFDEVLEDLKEIAKILPTKVIIGSGYLTDKEIEKASALVREAKAFCVKTATESDPLGHGEMKEKAKHIELMKAAAPGLKIKASGKIKTLKDVELMVEAGADIIGSSSSVKIIEDYKKKRKEKQSSPKKK